MREKFSFKGIKPKLVLSKGFAETRRHIVLKLLGYLLFSGRLKVACKIGYKYKPDLAGNGEDGKIIWVECGKVSEKKLFFFRRRRGDFTLFFLKAGLEEAEKFAGLLKKFSIDGIVYGFEDKFVRNISANLYRTNSVRCRFSKGLVNLKINGKTFVSRIYSNAVFP
ncbi:MAG: hypothetical protein J7L54_04110 [Elusimicrobia bacterium]|nr:hypothetical protein [Elusimicrobiota bacterium]